jgi:hypothetical protein
MRNHTVELGVSPVDEDCESLGRNYDESKAWKECVAFRAQLRRVYASARGEMPEGLTLAIKRGKHDFGEPLDVVARCDEANRKAIDAAYWLQDNLPLTWDEDARAELGL